MNEIEKAADVIKKGGIIAYPTDTLYALGASIYNEDAVRKVYEIKKRPASICLPVAVESVSRIEDVAIMNETAEKLAEKFLPGSLTLILRKRESVPEIVAGEKIAVRVPSNDMAIRLLSVAGALTATSANIHGRDAPSTVEDAREQMKDKVEMYLDGGKLKGVPSTIVDVSEGAIKVVREGAISEEELHG